LSGLTQIEPGYAVRCVIAEALRKWIGCSIKGFLGERETFCWDTKKPTSAREKVDVRSLYLALATPRGYRKEMFCKKIAIYT
jgi:hypothetical protein